jgi:murein L,D-transpeptidase YcbB/YkuD
MEEHVAEHPARDAAPPPSPHVGPLTSEPTASLVAQPANDRAILTEAHDRLVAVAEAGGFPEVPATAEAARPGLRHPSVTALRARLAAEGYEALPPEAVALPELFDSTVERALRAWQRDHVLPETGLADRATIRALSVPARHRASQVRYALQRADAQVHAASPTRVRVNIPAFEYTLLVDGTETMRGRVIVGAPFGGKSGGMTPEMQGAVHTVVAHPTWTPTRNYLNERLFPEERRRPGTIARRGFSRFRGSDGQAWYTLPPGPENPLGRLVLRFNADSVYYLHDTPDKELFGRRVRAHSSGCVRVDGVEELARAVAQLGGADVDALDAALRDEGRTKMLTVPRPVPVVVEYVTADVGPERRVRYHPDIYRLEPTLLPSLQTAAR